MIFEVCAIVNGQEVRHVAEYVSADEARKASEPHLGPNDKIVGVLLLPAGIYADTRRLAAALLDQTADDGYAILDGKGQGEE
jgi:hypothetical protein